MFVYLFVCLFVLIYEKPTMRKYTCSSKDKVFELWFDYVRCNLSLIANYVTFRKLRYFNNNKKYSINTYITRGLLQLPIRVFPPLLKALLYPKITSCAVSNFGFIVVYFGLLWFGLAMVLSIVSPHIYSCSHFIWN